MTPSTPGIWACAALAGFLASGCAPAGGEKTGGEGSAHAELQRQSDGSVVMTVHEDARSRLDVKIAAIVAATLAPESAAYGRVLDPSPFVALVTEERTDASGLDIATRELERSKRLVGDQNVSGRDFEAAAAAAAQARLALDDVHARMVMGWGADLADRKDLSDLVAALVRREAAIVRVDLPAHTAIALAGVHFAFADTPDQPIAATLLGSAPDVDPKVQGQGFFALVQPNTGHLASGAFLSAYLELEGASAAAALLPRAAVVRAETKAWVYVPGNADGVFHRVEVSLDRATPDGWLVTKGVHAGDRVVIEGAQQLLSEEALASGRAGN